jgi:hypothetical protein
MNLPGDHEKNHIGHDRICFKVNRVRASALGYQKENVKVMFVRLPNKKVLLEMIRKRAKIKIPLFLGLRIEVLNLVNGQMFLWHSCL